MTSLDGRVPEAQISFGFSDAAPVDGQPAYVMGRAPCTDYLAEFQGTGATQRFVNLVPTRRGCAPGATESAFLATLPLVSRMYVEAGRISFQGGGHLLEFQRAN